MIVSNISTNMQANKDSQKGIINNINMYNDNCIEALPII